MTRRILYRLLFDAFLELRENGIAKDDPKQFKLAELFHHYADWLEQLDKGQRTPADVVLELQNQSDRLKIRPWLDQRMAGKAASAKPAARKAVAQKGVKKTTLV